MSLAGTTYPLSVLTMLVGSIVQASACHHTLRFASIEAIGQNEPQWQASRAMGAVAPAAWLGPEIFTTITLPARPSRSHGRPGDTIWGQKGVEATPTTTTPTTTMMTMTTAMTMTMTMNTTTMTTTMTMTTTTRR